MAKKKKSNKLIYILLGVVAVLIVVVLVGKSQGWIGKKQSMEVEFSNAARKTIVEKVSASGAIQPEVEVKMTPDVAGEIIELNVEEGDSVMIGDRLIKIRPDNWQSAVDRTLANLNQQKANEADARARLERARANFDRAKLEYTRQKKLYEEKVISDADWELADSNYKVAQTDLSSAEENVNAAEYIVKSSQASVNEAKENLRLTTVLSPMNGTVSKLSVEKGERVVGTQQMAGTEMLRIADLNKMEVRVNVNENDIIRIAVGDTALIQVDSYTYLEKEFKGIVTQIANTANDKASADAVTEFEVRIRVLNSSYNDLINEKGIKNPLRPGMTASVDIITERKDKVLSVPLAAVTTRSSKDEKAGEGKEGESAEASTPAPGETDEVLQVVFLNDNGVAKMVEVKTGISDFENIEVLSGVKEGDEIISGPFLAVSKRLKDGEAVQKMGGEDKAVASKEEEEK
ncbi:MAG: efflux RND transporter periplasmic adaptor subunit [Imperialibacter sp.]